MLFHVTMRVNLPLDLDPQLTDELKHNEKARAQELQRAGTWRHLWRVAGQYANISIFDVGSHEELHDILSGLPLFPYLDIEVTPLARHPSALPES